MMKMVDALKLTMDAGLYSPEENILAFNASSALFPSSLRQEAIRASFLSLRRFTFCSLLKESIKLYS